MSSYTYKTIDLFAGIGGLRLGFEKTARCKNVFSSEIDTNACLTYINNFGEDPQLGSLNILLNYMAFPNVSSVPRRNTFIINKPLEAFCL